MNKSRHFAMCVSSLCIHVSKMYSCSLLNVNIQKSFKAVERRKYPGVSFYQTRMQTGIFKHRENLDSVI